METRIMKNNIKRNIINNKSLLFFYGFWLLFNFTFIEVFKGESKGFYPFHGGLVESGLLEFLFYLILPIICFGGWMLIKKNVIFFNKA